MFAHQYERLCWLAFAACGIGNLHTPFLNSHINT
jgi:hypothetical protein